ncbi:MAG: PKD domain-containing protein [Bacteroidales bacterium]|nr:PKD domain-containing protein [Bacteroidales bacterium]
MQLKNKLFTFAALLLLVSCNQQELDNSNPECVIVTPTTGTTITQRSKIMLRLDATDADGKIKNVTLSINGKDITKLTNRPFQYEWNTSDYEPGTYKIKFTASDDLQANGSDEIEVIIVENSMPQSYFSVSKKVTTVNEAIQFTDESINKPTKWEWNFGDGSISNEQNPKHTFEQIGQYTIKLFVENEFGTDSITKHKHIHVTPETSTVSDVDGNSYKTIKIGEQWWMAENLATTTYNDGTPIANLQDSIQWLKANKGAYCWHRDNSNNESNYGALYNYKIAEDKVCPSGWHIPSDDEWMELEKFIGMEELETVMLNFRSNKGYNLKSKKGWSFNYFQNNKGNGNDLYTFNALPGGSRSPKAKFGDLGLTTTWWTSTFESGENAMINRYLYYSYSGIGRAYSNKKAGNSIRCIKD